MLDVEQKDKHPTGYSAGAWADNPSNLCRSGWTHHVVMQSYQAWAHVNHDDAT